MISKVKYLQICIILTFIENRFEKKNSFAIRIIFNFCARKKIWNLFQTKTHITRAHQLQTKFKQNLNLSNNFQLLSETHSKYFFLFLFLLVSFKDNLIINYVLFTIEFLFDRINYMRVFLFELLVYLFRTESTVCCNSELLCKK